MYEFFCNVVTLKPGNRVGDLVGFVIKDLDGKRNAVSLNEAEKLVLKKEIKGLKLEPYTFSGPDGSVLSKGNLVFFEDGKPILTGKTEWHKDLSKSGDIEFSLGINEAIQNSIYL